MILRLSPAQQRVFVLHGLDRRLGVDVSRPMRIEPGDRITILKALAYIRYTSCHRRSAAAIRRKLDKLGTESKEGA